MNDKNHPTEPEPDSNRPRSGFWTRGRLTLALGALVSALMAIVLALTWFKEPPRSPDLLAGDRQRMEAFLAAHDYEAFLRLMELQPPEVRAELPPEWLRRYDEIKPALLFTVRETSTAKVINSAKPYQAPLLALRWSGDGKYLVDVLEPIPSKRKVFDGQTGRPASVSQVPAPLPETEEHWPLLCWDRPEPRPKAVSDQLATRLLLAFGHDAAFWRSQDHQRPVLLMSNPNDGRILTSFGVNPHHVKAINEPPIDPTGEPSPHFPELFEGMVNQHQRRCFNVWKADAFPE